MAKYIGTLTSDARGKLGGIVLTRARNGTNIKSHSVPVQPRSTYQLANRTTIAASIYAWRNLSQYDQNTWSALAVQYTWLNSLAQSYSPTGLQLWSQAFYNARQFNATPPSLAGTTPPIVYPVDDAIITNPSGVLTVQPRMSGAAYPYATFFALSSVISPSINYTKGVRRRFMGVSVGTGAINITAAWEAAYGTLPISGQRVSIRIVPVDESYWISGTPIILAVSLS